MAWTPIAAFVPQWVDSNGDPYSGAVLKAYQEGTSTNTNLATDNTGGTTATDIVLNASGYPAVGGSIVVPHIDQVVKLALYATQAAADADTGAVWSIDSIGGDLALLGDTTNVARGDALVGIKRTVANAVATDLHEWMDRRWYSTFDFMTDAQITDVQAGSLGEDVTTALSNCFSALADGDVLVIENGNYKTTDELELFDLQGVLIIGSPKAKITFQPAASDATKAILKWREVRQSAIIGGLYLTGSASIKPGFGLYVTSGGAGASNPTNLNQFDKVTCEYCSVSGIQVGTNGSNVDINLDSNVFNQPACRNNGVGIELSNSNTNSTTINNPVVTTNTNYGIKLTLFPRATNINYPQMAGNGTAQIFIAKDVSADIVIENWVMEMGSNAANNSIPMVQTEATGGGTTALCRLTLRNVRNTWTGTDTFNILDLAHDGTTLLDHCQFAGPTGAPSGTNASIKWDNTGAAGSTGGQHLLITNQVQLTAGAQWNINTSKSVHPIIWYDKGSSYSTTVSSQITNDRADSYIYNAKLYNQLITPVTVTDVTHDNIGLMGRQTRKFTIATEAWTAAATTESLVILTVPGATRIVEVVSDTTEAFAGLAGTITLEVGDTAAGNDTDRFILNHDVKTAVVTKGLVDADKGVGLASPEVSYTSSMTGATQIQVTLKSGSGNIGNGSTSNLTTGTVTVYVTTEVFG